MRRPGGFSLIELVLAIGLSIALMALIGSAINMHLIRLDESRSTVEQAQVARALLDRIVSDLQATTTAPTQDVSDLLKAAEASAQFDVDEVDRTSSDSDSSTSSTTTTQVMSGISGNLEMILIDRRRMSQALMVPAEAATPVPRANASWVQVIYAMSADRELPGLVRIEGSRDNARWRELQGEPTPTAEPIAPEVQAITFRYYDANGEVFEVWDMAQQEALPIAVEVMLTLEPADLAEDSTAPMVRRTPRTYRRLVRVAAADESVAEASSSTSEQPLDDFEGEF